jgi:polysaccharide biosynthesis protein PslG
MRGRLSQPVRVVRRSLCAVAIAALVACAGATASAADPPPDGYVGVNAQFLFPFFPPWYVDAHLEAMRAGGIETVRTDAFWHQVEPQPPVDGVHDYQWADLDHQVAALAAMRLRWLPILDYSAPWASAQPREITAPPRSTAEYADYAQALAARYGRGGQFWREHPTLPAMPVTAYEIWNEPNYSVFWRPEPDALGYADLYLSARTAIRSVDPQAEAIVGGLTGEAPESFLARMYAEQPALHGRVDAVGVHPYAGSVQAVVGLIAGVRNTLDDNGDTTVPIDVTELGWTTVGSGSYLTASDGDRGARLAWLVEHLANSDCRVERFIPHTWVTGESDTSDGEQWFGLYHADGSATASGRAYTEAALHLRGEGAGPPEALCDTAAAPAAEPVPPAGGSGAVQVPVPATRLPPAAGSRGGTPTRATRIAAPRTRPRGVCGRRPRQSHARKRHPTRCKRRIQRRR